MSILPAQEERWPTKTPSRGQVSNSGTAATAPGLAGVYGRLRITVAGKPVATLAVEGTYVALLPDTSGPADATLMCADDTSCTSCSRAS